MTNGMRINVKRMLMETLEDKMQKQVHILNLDDCKRDKFKWWQFNYS